MKPVILAHVDKFAAAAGLGGRLHDPTAVPRGGRGKGQISKNFQTEVRSRFYLTKGPKHEILPRDVDQMRSPRRYGKAEPTEKLSRQSFPQREEFAKILENPDTAHLVLLPTSEANRAEPADSNAGSGCSQRVGGDDLDKRQGAVRRKATEKVCCDVRMRLRPGSAPPDRTPCPSRMSALEQSICKYAEEPTKSVVRPALGLTFDSLGEAYDYYSLHIWEIGFGVRYGKSRLNAERTMCMHEIVCGCSLLTLAVAQAKIYLEYLQKTGLLPLRRNAANERALEDDDQCRRICDLARAALEWVDQANSYPHRTEGYYRVTHFIMFISFEVAGVQARNMQTMVGDVENIGGAALMNRVQCDDNNAAMGEDGVSRENSS
uniref:Uncharacterized protein n=1 Tax=Aegilops tauschii TaxID=37682 RepID=M8BLX4_AEGTA